MKKRERKKERERRKEREKQKDRKRQKERSMQRVIYWLLKLIVNFDFKNLLKKEIKNK